MDPLAAIVALAGLGTKALELATKIYDATPDEQKKQGAADWAKFVHNISDFILGVQDQVNKAVKP